MNNPNEVLVCWNQIKSLVDELELDVQKNATGVLQAGSRVRAGMSQLKKLAVQLRKLSLNQDKVVREARKAKKAAV